MITALDHMVLLVPDLEMGIGVYSTLLGRTPDWRATGEGGEGTALFQLGNTALELMAPVGDGPIADRLREIIMDTGPGLTSLVYATDDIAAAHHRLKRRGLNPQDIVPGSSVDERSGRARRWSRFRCDDAAMAGVKTFVIAQDGGALPVANADAGSVQTLDHIVIHTPNPDRAGTIYGARLGLDLALDRTAPQWNSRFLFFRIGGLTVEIINRLDDAAELSAPDKIYGLTWTVDDIQAAHARLETAGFNVSEVRTGRKPGTQVFTVRDGTMNVPTLFIAHSPR